MAKPYKIKRSTGRYSKKRGGRHWRGLVYLFLGLVLVYLGFVAGRPVLDWVSDHFAGGEQSSSSSPISSLAPSSASEVPIPDPVADLNAAELPLADAADPERLQAFIDNALAGGHNAAVLTLKNAEGDVLYRSENEAVKAVGAVAPTAIEIGSIAEKLRESGLMPIARISAFRDAKAAGLRREMAVRFRDNIDYIWLDNYAASGGKPWLNPYSAEARDYVAAVASEIADSGWEIVAVESLQFPSGVGVSLAVFPGGENSSRAELLQNFTASLAESLRARDSALILVVPAVGMLGNMEAQIGTEPFYAAAPIVAIDMSPWQFQGPLTLGGELIESPLQDPGNLADRVFTAIREDVKNSTYEGRFVLWVPGSAEGSDAMAEAARALGIEQVVRVT